MHWKFQFWPFFHSQKSSFLTFFTNAPIKNCSIFRICLISRSENCNFDQIWTAKIVPVYVLKMPVWIFAPFYFVKERSSQPHSLHSRHLRSQPTQIDVRLVAKAVIAVAAEQWRTYVKSKSSCFHGKILRQYFPSLAIFPWNGSYFKSSIFITFLPATPMYLFFYWRFCSFYVILGININFSNFWYLDNTNHKLCAACM